MPASTNDSSDRPHLVVLIHGINTRALWMSQIEPTLKSAGFGVARTSYGRFPIPQFLIPCDALRRRPIERVLGDIRLAIELHKPGKISAITHSFGTHVLATILKEQPDIRWHRIIFCGSVVRDDFPFDQVINRFDLPLMNEVGTRDIWPAVAESITWGFGSVGSHGFNRPPVESRWHYRFRHSDFLTSDFCRRYWIPFLREGTIKPAARPTPLAWQVGLFTALPLRWLVVAALAAGILAPLVPWLF